MKNVWLHPTCPNSDSHSLGLLVKDLHLTRRDFEAMDTMKAGCGVLRRSQTLLMALQMLFVLETQPQDEQTHESGVECGGMLKSSRERLT